MITEHQVTLFRTFGFLILRNLFTQKELGTIDAEFDSAMDSAYRHSPFDGTQRHWVKMMGPKTPFFASLLEDPRLNDVAEKLFGEDCLGVGTDANRYVGDTGWHPDTRNLHQYGVKFAYYLQPVDADSGALRVIPGSHKDPFHAELKRSLGESERPIGEVPGYVCKSEPGDVVAFDLRLWHGSLGGSDDRRMCTVVYYHNPKTPEEEEATRTQAANNAKNLERYNRPDDPLFDPGWVANPRRSAKRQRTIDRMRELGFLDYDEGRRQGSK